MIGIRDRNKGTLKLLPAAGGQVVRIQARLHDIPYDDAQLEAADTSDIAKRVALATSLARNFGSSRRVRQLGQKAVVKQVEGNVLQREGMEVAISEMGKHAEQAGLTTAQVLAKAAGERTLPPHNLAATTANEAYSFASIVNKAGQKHLDIAYLRKAMADKEHLAALRAGHKHRRKCDAFVDHVLDLAPVSMEGGDMHAACQEAAGWLALYSACSKAMKVRPGTTIDAEQAEADEAEVEEEEEEKDAFAYTRKQATFVSLASRHGFPSAAACEWVLRKFGDIDGEGVYTRSAKQQQMLRATTAVAAVRCRGNTLAADSGGALLAALAPMSPREVMDLLRSIGCKVTKAASSKFDVGLTAKLLPASKTSVTLAEALPVIKLRAGPRK